MAKGNSSARGGRPFRGGRGRGRGQGGGRGTGRGRGGQPGSSLLQEDLDFTVQMYADAAPTIPSSPGPFAGGRRGQTPQRGRGRGGPGPSRGQFSNLNVGTSSPNRGRGRGWNRGREFDSRGGRRRYSEGIGASPRDRGGPIRPRTTLSELLLQERPLLHPVIFVPSVHTRVLFQDEEDLLQPLVEEVDDTEQSHVPTADRVSRVFSGRNAVGLEGSEDDLDEEMQVVDFNDVGKLFDSTIRTSESTAATRKSTLSVSMVNEENQPSGAHVTLESQQPSTNFEDLAQVAHATLSLTERSHNILMGNPASTEVGQTPAFRSDDDDDDDIIVYVAPHPRNALSRPKDVLEKATDQVPALNSTSCIPDPPPLSSIVFSSATSSMTVNHMAGVSNGTSTTPTTPRLHIPPITTTRQAKLWKQKLGRANKRKQRVAFSSRPSFGAFGAIREEALLNKFEEKRDKRYGERRRGDSDLEWGDTDDDNVEGGGSQDEIESDMQLVPKVLEKGKGKAPADEEEDLEDHGMDVDADLVMDALKSFVGGLLGPDAGKHVTMDEVKDEDTMRIEDEMDWHEQRTSSENDDEGDGDEDEDETGDEELETAIRVEEAKLLAESEENQDVDGADDVDSEDEEGSEDGQCTRRSFQSQLEQVRNSALQRKNGDASFEDDDEDEDDDEGLDNNQFAQRSFQARLERLRNKALHRNGDTSFEDNYEEDSDDLFKQNLAWAEEDDDLINQIHDMLDENEDILERKGKKQGKEQFRDLPGIVVNGIEGIITPRKRKKDRYRDLPLDLRVQWEKDRLKKADYKNAREFERLARAADPLSRKKGGKKGRKAMLAAASSDPTIVVLPNRVIDLTTLVQQIRRFTADIGGPSSMALPPTNKATRKDIHEIALAFGLKSQSKGKESVRYTTLYKTSMSGIRVDEAKVAKIMRRSGGPSWKGESFGSEGWKRKSAGTMLRQREGDEVGKAAPKIDETNVGFRLLTMMGWSEGDRVGASMKGLAAPLPAIIKTSKLGLGALKSRKTIE